MDLANATSNTIICKNNPVLLLLYPYLIIIVNLPLKNSQ
jgi:branched-subunit amino acid permease